MAIRGAKKYFPVALSTTLLVGISALFFGFPGRHLVTISPIILGYVGLIFVFVLVNFFTTGLTDPGTYPKRAEPEDDEDELRAPVYITVLIHDISVRMKWCSTCNFYRPPRVSHCSMCNSCIEKFDHHCPWINNCIGRRNYQYFFWFLLLLSIHMVNIFSFTLWSTILNNQSAEKDDIIYGVSIAIMVVVCLLFIPIFGLLCFHISLVTRGRTTNEQVTGKFRSGVNPFDDGCLQNCGQVVCSMRMPRYLGHEPIDYEKKYTITPPFKSDRDNLSLRDVNVQVNGREGNKVQHSPTSSNSVPAGYGKERSEEDAGNQVDVKAGGEAATPEVKIMGVQSQGSIRKDLDPDRFRAKVTPVHSSSCQPTDALAYACMEPQPNLDDISDNGGQNFEMTALNSEKPPSIGEHSPGHSVNTKMLPSANGSANNMNGRRDSKKSYEGHNTVDMHVANSNHSNSLSPPVKLEPNSVIYDNLVIRGKGPVKENGKVDAHNHFPEYKGDCDILDPKNIQLSIFNEMNANFEVGYAPRPAAGCNIDVGVPDVNTIESMTNMNNCNNGEPSYTDQSGGNVCESGYISAFGTANSSKLNKEDFEKDPDLTNKIELDNAMRDIEAHVALLQLTENEELQSEMEGKEEPPQKALEENGHVRSVGESAQEGIRPKSEEIGVRTHVVHGSVCDRQNSPVNNSSHAMSKTGRKVGRTRSASSQDVRGRGRPKYERLTSVGRVSSLVGKFESKENQTAVFSGTRLKVKSRQDQNYEPQDSITQSSKCENARLLAS